MEGVLRWVPLLERSANCRRPLQLEVTIENGFDLQRFVGLNFKSDDSASLMHRHEQSFAHREIVACVDDRARFRTNNQSAGESLGRYDNAAQMELQMKVAANFKWINPRFKSSLFVPEQCGLPSDGRNKFPGSNWSGEFKRLSWLSGKCQAGGEKQGTGHPGCCRMQPPSSR